MEWVQAGYRCQADTVNIKVTAPTERHQAVIVSRAAGEAAGAPAAPSPAALNGPCQREKAMLNGSRRLAVSIERPLK